jgi:hypothetical protein
MHTYKVTVTLNNGLTIRPEFEPAPGRLDALRRYYAEAYHNYEISGYTIENLNGVIVHREAAQAVSA